MPQFSASEIDRLIEYSLGFYLFFTFFDLCSLLRFSC